MDVLFHLPKEREGSGGRKRREEQAADKERRDIQEWMSFFICPKRGKIPAAENGERNKPLIKREGTFRNGCPFRLPREENSGGCISSVYSGYNGEEGGGALWKRRWRCGGLRCTVW